MRKLLILGSSLSAVEMVKYAQSQDVYVIVTDYLPPEKSAAKKVANEYWMLNTNDIQNLENKCKEENISAVFCGVSEFNLEMVMELCKRLELPFYADEGAWRYSRDKKMFKEACRRGGVRVAEDYHVDDDLKAEDLQAIKYPVVVKPVDLSGNLGVSYCYNESELIEAYHKARSLSENPNILVERMLKGEEWHGFYALADGEIRLLALNAMYAQPGEPSNCYSITTTATNHVKQYIQEVSPLLECVLQDIGCKEGVAWVQVMLDEDGCFYVIEMGYRLTGEGIFVPYKELIGFDVLKWMVDYALGEKHTCVELPPAMKTAYKECACSYMLWTNREGIIAECSGLEDVAELPGVIVDSFAFVGKSMGQYRPMGIIHFESDSCEEMCRMIECINEKLCIKDEQGNDMLIKYTNYDYLQRVYEEGVRDFAL